MKEPSAELIIDIDIIRNNIIYLKSLLNPNSKFMAVLKKMKWLKLQVGSIPDWDSGAFFPY